MTGNDDGDGVTGDDNNDDDDDGDDDDNDDGDSATVDGMTGYDNNDDGGGRLRPQWQRRDRQHSRR